MIFSKHTLSLVVAALVLVVYAARPAPGQIPDYSDLQNLSGLRTMANTPTETQSGMEVGNINIPNVTADQMNLQERLPDERAAQSTAETMPVQQILFDTAKINPDQYVVGPDDQLLLYLFGQLDKQYPISITPEGTVNIPTVGSVSVANMTLARAKETIIREVSKKYKGLAMTVTLIRPRYFRVFASGQVRRPGAINAHALMRVSDVVATSGLLQLTGQSAAAAGQNVGTTGINTSDMRQVSSQRSIIIHRESGDVPVDLIRFRTFGDLSVNPYVQAGDRIEVKSYLGSVYIYGQVNVQGRYELKPGDRILDMIRFAGGITPVADTTRATLTRFDNTGKVIDKITIDLYDALLNNPDAPQYVLQESDRLSVWAKKQYKQINNISIRGEVEYPGTYPIIPNETTLTQVLIEAGGFTSNANLEESTLIRRSSTVQDLEYERLSRTPIADMTEEEKDIFKNMSRTRRGSISVDFVKLFRENDQLNNSANLLNNRDGAPASADSLSGRLGIASRDPNDIPLQSGDVITIPTLREFVNVMGAVQQPGFMRLQEGQDANYYITKAGGYNWNASKSKMRVIKARTGQRFRPSGSVRIEPGDTIHIPEKKPVDVWAAVKDAALVFANAATIILLARQLSE